MPTIENIARNLGISSATVSRALNGSRLISEEVRGRVCEYAERVGYQRRCIRRHRGRAILNIKLVLPSHQDPARTLFYDLSTLVRGLKEGFHLCGINLLCEIGDNDYDPFPHKKGGDIDGFVFAFQEPAPHVVKSVIDSGTPIVVLNRSLPNLPCVACDHEAGMKELVDHLVAQGNEKPRPHFIAVDEKTPVPLARRDGLAVACRSHGIDFDIERDVTNFPKLGLIHGSRLKLLMTSASVLMCMNDIVASIVLAELERLHIRVPEDIEVTGFDDSPVRQLTRPLLTTVHMPVEEIARQAAIGLQEMILNHTVSDSLRLVKGTLAVGGSTRART